MTRRTRALRRGLLFAFAAGAGGCIVALDFDQFDTDRPIAAVPEGGGDEQNNPPSEAAAAPFDITVSIPSDVVRLDSTVAVTVTLVRKGPAFDGEVVLGLASVPEISLVAPVSIPRGQTTAILSVRIGRPPYGPARIDVSATSGALAVTRSLNVQVAGKAGTFDTSFGVDGVLVTSAKTNKVKDAVVMPDGTIVVLGEDPPVVLVRFTPAGKVDATFGDGGVANGPDAGKPRPYASRLVRVDGGVVASGQNCTFGGTFDCNEWAARYTTSGQLDPAWGTGGMVLVPYLGLTLTPSGDAVIVGSSTQLRGALSPVFVKLRPNGTFDTTYGDAGVAQPDYGYDSGAQSVSLVDAVPRDGGGLAISGVRQNYIQLVGMVRSDGRADTTFANGDLRASPVDAGYPTRLTSLPDGRLLTSGEVQPAPLQDPVAGYVVAYRPDGSVDPTFGVGGRIELAGAATVRSVVAIPGDALYVTSTLRPQGVELRRYTFDGKQDVTFGATGILRYVPIDGPTYDAEALALPDPTSPRITIVTEQSAGLTRDIVLMRFWR